MTIAEEGVTPQATKATEITQPDATESIGPPTRIGDATRAWKASDGAIVIHHDDDTKARPAPGEEAIDLAYTLTLAALAAYHRNGYGDSFRHPAYLHDIAVVGDAGFENEDISLDQDGVKALRAQINATPLALSGEGLLTLLARGVGTAQEALGRREQGDLA